MGGGGVPEKFGRLSSAYRVLGERVRFFEGDDCLEDMDGVEGIAKSTRCGPRHVLTIVDSHSITFDVRFRNLPMVWEGIEGCKCIEILFT